MSTASKGKGEVADEKSGPNGVSKPTLAKVVPAVKQEGESNTTMKIEKQIKDVDTDAKDYHDIKNMKK